MKSNKKCQKGTSSYSILYSEPTPTDPLCNMLKTLVIQRDGENTADGNFNVH